MLKQWTNTVPAAQAAQHHCRPDTTNCVNNLLLSYALQYS